ncbi:MAG: methyltransferase domain-containing protein [bacterium]|nr:methyltransferase domain-containing protein [bacterium]
MEFTGERMVPGQAPLMLEMAHRARYQFAEGRCQGKSVLDFGCGAGYGSQMLSRLASKVLGIDISREAVEFAQNNYQGLNLSYSTGDINSLLSRADRFEVAVCFEVIEHLEEPGRFLSSLASVMTDSGQLVISTPNGKDEQNPYHHHGWDAEGFSAFLSSDFKDIKLYGQGASQEILKYRADQLKALEQAGRQAESIKRKNPLTKLVPPWLRKTIYAWLVERKLPREKRWNIEDFPVVEGMENGEIIIAVCSKKQH